MKKLILCLGITMLCLTSAAFGYYQGSNMSSSYPAFKEKLPYAATEKNIAKYTEKAQNYINACNNDISTIESARDLAIRESQEVLQKYREFRSKF